MYLSYKLAAFLTRCMVRNGSIEDNQYDAYLYCLDYLLELVVYFVTTFLFGLLLGYPLFGILYTLILFSLKSCCGGIHAPSRLLCTLFSYLCFFAAFGLFSLRHQIPDTAWFFITLAWLPGDLLYKRQRQCHKRIYKRSEKTPGMAPPPGILYLSGNLCPFLVVRT